MNPPITQRWALYASHLGQYMRRWIFRHPWGTVRVHNIQQSDEGRDFHDHPFSFVSIILRGGYVEHVPGCTCMPGDWDYADHGLGWHFHTRGYSWFPCRYYGPGSVVRRRGEDLHRLEMVNGQAWTLVFSTRYFRMWGFLTRDGWVNYQSYHRSYYKTEAPEVKHATLGPSDVDADGAPV